MARQLQTTFDAIDAQDVETFLAGLSPDVVFTFGNNPSAVGHDQVRGAVEGFWSSIGGLKHHLQDMWHPEPDVSVANLQVEYTRLDGGVVTVPCVDVLRWDGDTVSDWRIVIDLAPVYAPAEEAAAV
jgi:ketosteroid isomerase-like protein